MALNKISVTFLQLLSVEPYEKITVRELTKKAQIPRTSFYNLYDSKDELANAILMQEMQTVCDYIARKFTSRQKDNQITEDGLDDLLARWDIITKLWKINNSKIDLTKELEKEVSKSAQQAIHHRYKNADTDKAALFGELFAGCFVKTMEWYHTKEKQVTTKQLAQQINICLYDGMIHLFDF